MVKKQKDTKSEYTGLVPAVDQAGKILHYLAQNPFQKLNLTDICRKVAIHKSKGYTILNTLQKHGLVRKDSLGKTYTLGLGLISLSRKLLDSLNYNELAGPLLNTLAGKTHSTALFGLISDMNVVVVAKQEADQQIGITTRIGYRFSITHGAHGKAIIAFLPENIRRKILKQAKLYFHGTAVKFNRKRLESEIIQCRETGFAFDMGELNVGINVIASPVFDSNTGVIGAIFIMGTFPESNIKEYGITVNESARQFSTMLGADVEQSYRY